MSHFKQIQANMIRTGLITHINYLFYFNVEQPNVYVWNTIIKEYCKSKFPKVSVFLFHQMVRENFEMNKQTFVYAIKACELVKGGVRVGEELHCRICKVGFDSELLIRNVLMHLYGKHGCLSSARNLFDESLTRDVFTWTTMIDCYAQKQFPGKALKLFCLMLRSGVEPNEVTMVAVLSACCILGNLSLGRLIHGYIEKNDLECSLNLLNALMDLYVKCGCLTTAREIFDMMERRDVYSWTIMTDGHAKQGELELARQFFDGLPEKNVVSWNAMIAGYSQKNKPKEALALFHQMEETSLRPVEGTLVCVLSSCAQLGSLDLGKKIYHYYVDQKRVQPSVILANAYIDMCAKCGSIDAAIQLFNGMPKKDLVSWNSMINGYAVHGYAGQALDLFRQMQSSGLRPDDITLVGVLSACCHGGLVIQGREYFENMRGVFGIEPNTKHYACMIDLLGRVGMLDDAFELIKRMPMEPDEAAWGALLNASKMYGNIDLGKFASVKLLELTPNDSGTYALLANMFAAKRRWDDVGMVRSMMRARGVKKTPGLSSIEVDGKTHEFLVEDKSHPQFREMYKLLDDILLLLYLEGYVPQPP
ncbi:hypothetical protein AQUCO_00700908v1 [Aquilegia coerulea]|uniref:Uncharacterized protein n=1 Tax=Aquilegia coerulea TaxID=218851 RepID=A0A2G5EM79_AQUCA|nr:hypothetical protein AQUCO_00700908v1 [Aquilegia coerulea]